VELLKSANLNCIAANRQDPDACNNQVATIPRRMLQGFTEPLSLCNTANDTSHELLLHSDTNTTAKKKQVRTTETKENKIVIEALPMTMAQGDKTVLGRSKVLSQMLATTRSIS